MNSQKKPFNINEMSQSFSFIHGGHLSKQSQSVIHQSPTSKATFKSIEPLLLTAQKEI